MAGIMGSASEADACRGAKRLITCSRWLRPLPCDSLGRGWFQIRARGQFGVTRRLAAGAPGLESNPGRIPGEVIHGDSMRTLIATTLLLVVACSRNRDGDTKTLVGELERLDTSIEEIVKKSPDEAGLREADALIGAKSGSLHSRVLELTSTDVKLSPAMSEALTNACVRNASSAKIARDYVYNAVLNGNPEIKKRANEVSRSLCKICETPSFASACSTFDPGP
jgi:hypothetical protein